MTSIMKPIWQRLADECRADPTLAAIEMRAVCDSAPGDPRRWTVTGSPGSRQELTVGLHPAVGGDGAGPCPGELVAMALAACMDGSLRLHADLMGIELDRIRVEVVNRGDARGFLRVTDVEPPADTGITMAVEIEAQGATDEQLTDLRAAAEATPGVLSMLRNQVAVEVTWS